MRRIGETMQAASLCGLGKAAPRPLLSLLRNWERQLLAESAAGGTP
jgi:NADH:ubiquinone oxidoreductase subunit F (NADH-binding)